MTDWMVVLLIMNYVPIPAVIVLNLLFAPEQWGKFLRQNPLWAVLLMIVTGWMGTIALALSVTGGIRLVELLQELRREKNL